MVRQHARGSDRARRRVGGDAGRSRWQAALVAFGLLVALVVGSGPAPAAAESAGSISGVVRLDGTPLFAAQVCAVRWMPAAEFCVYSRTDGTYHIDLAQSANYFVEFRDRVQRFATECYPNVPGPCSPDNAEIGPSSWVPITGGRAATGIDGDVGDAPPPPPPTGDMSGTVASSGNLSVGGISVCALNTRRGDETCSSTSASGSWTISGLPTANYIVRFVDPSGAHAPLCYRSSRNCDAPSVAGLVAPGGRTGIDVTLPARPTCYGQ